MPQINVHLETHKLVRALSYKTGKSIHQVAKEAFEAYDQSLLAGELILNRYLQLAPEILLAAIKDSIGREAASAIKQTVAQLRAQLAKKSEAAAREAEQAIAAKDALPKPKTVHATKPWLDGSPESDDIKAIEAYDELKDGEEAPLR